MSAINTTKLALRTSAIEEELRSWEITRCAAKEEQVRNLIIISGKIDALYCSLEGYASHSSAMPEELASLQRRISDLRKRISYHSCATKGSTTTAAHSFAIGRTAPVASFGGAAAMALEDNAGNRLKRVGASFSLRHPFNSPPRTGSREAQAPDRPSSEKGNLGKRATLTRISTTTAKEDGSSDCSSSSFFYLAPSSSSSDSSSSKANRSYNRDSSSGDEKVHNKMSDEETASPAPVAARPRLDLAKVFSTVGQPSTTLENSVIELVSGSSRRVRPREDFAEDPSTGRDPSCGIVRDGPIESFSRPTDFGFFPDGIAAKFSTDIAMKDEPTKKALKAVLQAILVDYPDIGSFHLLSITAEAVKKITGIDVSRYWNLGAQGAVWTSLAPIPLEYPAIECPSLEGHERLYQQMKWLVSMIPQVAAEQLMRKLHAIITASPALIPSYMNMLASQAYYQACPGVRGNVLLWPMGEHSLLHTQRMYHCLHRALSQKAMMDMLKERISSLSPEQKLILKRALSVCAAESSFLSPEQKLHLAQQIVQSMAGTSEEALSPENVLELYQGALIDVPLITDLPVVSVEGCESLRVTVFEIGRSSPVETLRLIIKDLKQIVDLSFIFDRDTVLQLANQAFTLRGMPQPAWTEENPVLLITRIILLAASPGHW